MSLKDSICLAIDRILSAGDSSANDSL